NEFALRARTMEEDFTALRQVVGREGKTRRRLRTGSVTGGWARCVSSVNDLLDDVTMHTDEIARVVTAVSQGDLSQTIATSEELPLGGDFYKHARAVNGMVTQ